MKIVIIGQGGHSKVIRDIIEDSMENELVGFLDDKYDEITFKCDLYYGPISAAHKLVEWFNNVKFIIAIGNNKIRRSVYKRLELPDDYYITLIQKTAVISPSAKIGKGTVVMANVVINAEAQIGNHAIINTGSIVEHENLIGDFVHISPKATLTGAVVIEEGAHIGAGAVIIPNVKAGEWSTIGAGATVINDIPSYCTVVGVPAKIKSNCLVNSEVQI